MVIAVIGWGSLIWNPGTLPLGSGWFEDGPKIPVEFARQSNDGRLTLVVYGEKAVPTLWAKLYAKGRCAAIEALRKREGTVEKHIGWAFADEKTDHSYTKEFSDWARAKNLDGVVWTGLPSKWGKKTSDNGKCPSIEQAINHLKELEGAKQDLAFEYIKKTPPQVRTPYRGAFEKAFPELKAKS